MKSNIVQYRAATARDVAEIARVCAQNGENESYWRARIDGYLSLEFNPHQSTVQRLVYVAVQEQTIIGFIAGHLTKRNDYPGQVQWIMIAETFRRSGIASELLTILAGWFSEHHAIGVRTDIDPGNPSAEMFYRHHHASGINKYWLYWDDIRIVRNNTVRRPRV